MAIRYFLHHSALMWSAVAFLLFCVQTALHAQVQISAIALPGGRVRISWPNTAGTYQLESTTAVNLPWSASGFSVQAVGDQNVVDLPSSDTSRFFRLRATGGKLLTIASSSPGQNETGVAVTRETIFRLTGPLASDTTLGVNQVFAFAVGRKLLSRVELSSDRRTVTLFPLENLPSDTQVDVTFDGTGVFDLGNQPIDLDGDGVVGGVAHVEYQTLSTTALATTGVEGHVFASEKNPDGSDRPLQNVTITVDGMEETLRTTTDASGFFRLVPCPAGRFFVSVDGRTAEGSQWPGGAYYPFVGKAWDALPGRTNNLAGGSGVVYLPLIQADALKPISSAAGTKITFAPSVLATNPALAGVEIDVPANALFSDNGTRGGKVGIAPVPFDRLPEPLPPGLNLPLVITIQTDGPRNFDQPVPVKFPNLPDPVTGVKLPPGAKSALWSFNHDTGHWEIQGPATVTADGNFVVTDPGVGVRQPGWHGANPAGSGGGPGPGPNPDNDDDDDDGDGDDDDCMKVVTCSVRPPGRNAAWCLLDCAESYFSHNEAQRSRAFQLGLCAGNTVVCPSHYEDILTEKERGCMEECMFPDPQKVYYTIPCEEFIDCNSFEPPRKPLSALAASSGGPIPPDRLAEQIRLWRVEGEYLRALANTPKITETSSADVELFTAFFTAFNERTAANTPSGIRLSAQERTELIALPRPGQFSAAEWTALIDRLESMQAGPLPANVQTAKAQREAVITELLTRGWKTTRDGLRQGLVRRSLAVAPQVGSAAFPARAHYFRLVSLDTGFEQRGRLNTGGKFENIILAPNNLYAVYYFDPVTRNGGGAVFLSRSAGRITQILTAPLEPSTPDEPDSDGDQLSDVVEKIIGTSPLDADSDGDGAADGVELANGTNPSDGTPLGLGVVATRKTQRIAMGVDTMNDTAVVADGLGGITVFDVANPLAPVVLSQYTPVVGNYSAVSVADQFVVGVPGVPLPNSGGVGVSVLRLSPDGALTSSATIPTGANSETVLAAGRYAYVQGKSGSTTTVAVINLKSGLLLHHVPLTNGTASITSMALDGDVLWLVRDDRLYGFKISGDDLVPLSQTPIAGFQNSPLEQVTAGANRVYLGGLRSLQVWNVSNPANPALLFTPSASQALFRDVALSGSGTILGIITFNGGGQPALSLNDVSRDTSTNFLVSFPVPGTAAAVTMHRGYALVGAGTAGLAVVNILAPDRGTNPPTVTLRTFTSHPDGQEADEDFYVSPVTSDDVQVRDVEFYIDGAAVARKGNFPFALTLSAPSRTNGKTSFTLRAKATDTGGNSAWSSDITLKLLPDVTPPRLISVTPAPDSVLPRGSVSALSATFDSAVTLTSLQTGWTVTWAGADETFGTADDVSVAASDITFVPEDRTAFLRFAAPLVSGKYRARIADTVTDAGGNTAVGTRTWDFSIPVPVPVESLPANGTVWVTDTLRRFEVRFDERLSAGSVTPTSLQVLSTNGANTFVLTGGLASLSADGRGAVLELPQALPNGGYRVVFTSAIKDVYGSSVRTNLPISVLVKGYVGWANDLSGLWLAGTNWSNNIIPITGDHVIIDRPSANPTVTLRGSASVTTLRSEESFVFDRASLGVREKAVFNGSFNWNGQSELVGGKIELRGGGVITGSGNKFLERTELRNAGVLEWQHGGIISRLETVFHNLPSGTFLINKDETDGFVPISGTLLFKNEGTLRKEGGVDLTFFDGLSVFNTGLVDVKTGTLELSTATTNAGVMQVAAGAQILLGTSGGVAPRGGNFTQWSAGRVSGQGHVVFGGRPLVIAGTVDIDGIATILAGTTLQSTAAWRSRTLNIPAASFNTFDCSFDSDVVVGAGGLTLGRDIIGTGNFRVEGPCVLTRGTIGGQLTVRPDGGFVITNVFQVEGSARFLNAAVGRLATNSTLLVEQDGQFENERGGTLDLGENGVVQSTRLFSTNRTAFVYNAGLIRKSINTNVARIVGYFQNDGRVAVDAGSVRVESTGVHKGKFEIAAGTTLNFADQLNDFAPESDISGAGNALFSSRETSPVTHPLVGILRGKINPARLIVQRGTVRVFPETVLPPTELTSGGIIEVASELDLTNPVTIETGFFMPQAGVTNAIVRNHTQLVVTGSSGVSQGLVLVNASGAQITALREINIGSLGLIHNQAGATYIGGGTNSSNPASSLRGILWNEGTFTGNYSNLVDNGLIVTNTGLYEIQGGPLRLTGKFHQRGGELRLNGRVELDTGFLTGSPKPLLLEGGNLTGTGSILYTNDNVRFITNHASVIKPGLPIGTLKIGDDFAQESAGSLEIEIGGLTPGTEHDQLIIPNRALLGGTLRLQLRDGFVPAIGDEFVIMTFRSRSAGIQTTFQTIEGQSIGGGKQLDVLYDVDRVRVRCVAAP